MQNNDTTQLTETEGATNAQLYADAFNEQYLAILQDLLANPNGSFSWGTVLNGNISSFVLVDGHEYPITYWGIGNLDPEVLKRLIAEREEVADQSPKRTLH